MFDSKQVIITSSVMLGAVLGAGLTYYTMNKRAAGMKADFEALRNDPRLSGNYGGTDVGELNAKLKEAKAQSDKLKEELSSANRAVAAHEMVQKQMANSNVEKRTALIEEITKLNEDVVLAQKTIDYYREQLTKLTGLDMFKTLFRIASTDNNGEPIKASKLGNGEYLTPMREVDLQANLKKPGVYAVTLNGQRRGVFIVREDGHLGLLYERYSSKEGSAVIIFYDTVREDSIVSTVNTDIFTDVVADFISPVVKFG